MSGIKIVHLNAQSLFPKIEHIRIFLAQNEIHVLAISESWLHNEIQDNEINVPGYTYVRRDRPGRDTHGGTAFYISHK